MREAPRGDELSWPYLPVHIGTLSSGVDTPDVIRCDLLAVLVLALANELWDRLTPSRECWSVAVQRQRRDVYKLEPGIRHGEAH